ncbi:MAG: DUF4384 domain-containing protein [Ideonella sp.]|nr:DUF4384 domain-containing protein [Ideonella sp.]MCC7457523.1 DUF4384 domain-containing protein [Nitrospira sp.]
MGQHDPGRPSSSFGNLDGSTLPEGHALQEFVIEGVLGIGGFGIVYRARDTRLQRAVALKEYMPSMVATRRSDLVVTALSGREQPTFDTGLRSFVNEAQLLASFDHPSLVKVYRFWEGNGTAYMVMPLYQGVTLKAWLRSQPVRPDQAWLLSLLRPLTFALEQLHNAQPCCLHRDVAPDNILLLGAALAGPTAAAQPLLLDFGAARRVIADMTHNLTVFLKPGYAPIEQYGAETAMKQGPWTDVYALAAVMYACITGRAPLAAADRVLADDLVPAVQAGAGRYERAFLAAIDAGLSVRPEQRPQSMQAFRELFDDDAPTVAPAVAAAADALGAATELLPRPVPADAATRLEPRHAPDRRAAAALAAAVLVAVAGTAWWTMRGTPDRRAGADAPGRSASAGPAASVLAQASDRAASGAASGLPLPVEAAASAQLLPTAEPFSVMAALDDIVAHSDPNVQVTVEADPRVLVIGRDALRFRVRSNIAGHVYVFSGGTDKRSFHLLFPNRIDGSNRIAADAELMLPRKSWQISAEGPAGTNHLVVLVSPHLRNLSRAGLRQTGEPIPEFDLALAERLWRQRGAGASPFVGTAECVPRGCVDRFGAALLAVQEVAGDAPQR